MDPTTRNFVFIDGFYKALIFINLGIISYELSNYLKTLELTKYKKIIYSILEVLFYIFLILNTHYDIFGSCLTAVLFSFNIALTFSNISYVNNLFKSRFWKRLGKFGFILYLNHCYLRTFCVNNFNYSYNRMLIIYWIMIISISCLSYIIVEMFHKK